MVKSYVLIKAKTGFVQSALEKIRKIKKIEKADSVTGKYDVIVKIKVEETNEILNIVAGKIQDIEGIDETKTCIAT